MHRAHISLSDMTLAAVFIDAALELEKTDPHWRSNYTHLALVVAAVIYYARPFGSNEGGRRRKSKRRAPKGAPPLNKVDIGPISHIITSRAGQRLHHSVIRVRNKIVAHAESRYFPVRMIAAHLPQSDARFTNFAIKFGQTFPSPDLKILRANAKQLCSVFALHGHYAGVEVRKTRKRLRRE